MYCNGILVTSNTPSSQRAPGSAYRGVAYGVPWPLACVPVHDPEDEDLNRTIDHLTLSGFLEDGTFPPFVITQAELVNRYTSRCRSRGNDIRVLLCSTPRPWPLMDEQTALELKRDALLLGYDYAYSSCSYSALHGDLVNPPSPELSFYAERLNAFGLLDSLEDLELYADARWDYVQSQGERFVEVDGRMVRCTVLEDNGDFVPFLLYELPGY